MLYQQMNRIRNFLFQDFKSSHTKIEEQMFVEKVKMYGRKNFYVETPIQNAKINLFIFLHYHTL